MGLRVLGLQVFASSMLSFGELPVGSIPGFGQARFASTIPNSLAQLTLEAT